MQGFARSCCIQDLQEDYLGIRHRVYDANIENFQTIVGESTIIKADARELDFHPFNHYHFKGRKAEDKRPDTPPKFEDFKRLRQTFSSFKRLTSLKILVPHRNQSAFSKAFSMGKVAMFPRVTTLTTCVNGAYLTNHCPALVNQRIFFDYWSGTAHTQVKYKSKCKLWVAQLTKSPQRRSMNLPKSSYVCIEPRMLQQISHKLPHLRMLDLGGRSELRMPVRVLTQALTMMEQLEVLVLPCLHWNTFNGNSRLEFMSTEWPWANYQQITGVLARLLFNAYWTSKGVDVGRAGRRSDGSIEQMEWTEKAAENSYLWKEDYAADVTSTNWWESLDPEAPVWQHFLNIIGA